MTNIKNIEQSKVLMKAFNNACITLNYSNDEKSKLLGVNELTLTQNMQKGFLPNTKTYEVQLHFIKMYCSLFTMSGGDSDLMFHWFHFENQVLSGVPASLCLSLDGLLKVIQYLDRMQGINRFTD